MRARLAPPTVDGMTTTAYYNESLAPLRQRRVKERLQLILTTGTLALVGAAGFTTAAALEQTHHAVQPGVFLGPSPTAPTQGAR
jgi:Tfp pilus assembly protein PilN